MFDTGQTKYPKSWKEMSLDFKLLMIYHLCMMVLFATGQFFTIQILFAAAGLLIAGAASISIHHRMKSEWHWPGAGIKDVLGAIAGVALGLFFLNAATPRFPPLNPRCFAWYAAGAGILLFSILASLKIVFPSEAEFRKHCGDRQADDPDAPKAPEEPSRNRKIRAAFRVYFMLVWILAVCFFWKFNTAYRDGTAAPTAEHTEALSDHGKTVYITADEKAVIGLLKYAVFLGIPSALAAGLFLHFVLKIPMDPRMGISAGNASGHGKPPPSA